ncbi:MAG: hypothetical protein KJ897_04095 [Alphaproteobacteria bacterium]|nr:hypothetical protein [Hoeflea sp.]MBU4543590.1 hypothetical protein [Alphaproteobacteria bacterium]MBU4549215.1 hypothetical protein [Alphaproteobacteria bacterium]
MTTEHATISEAQAAKDRQSKSRVAFPLAGDDAYLHFNLKSIAALETAAGLIVPDWMDRGFNSFGLIERLTLDGNAAMIRAILDSGLKRLGEDGKMTLMAEVDLDEIDWPMSEVARPALEVICHAYHGETYSEVLAKAMAAAEAAEGGAA